MNDMTERILYIEDKEQSLYLVTFLLKTRGYEVFQAHDGQEGINLAIRIKPDVILLDIQLPSMDGYTVARMLRSNPDFIRTPIVALTSYVLPGDREKALASGCTGYIEKPIDPDTFLDQIEMYLQNDGVEGERAMTTILIVDDNFQNLYMLETIIKSSGYEVISAKNGAEALDLGRETPPDLVISDILMPVMDGFELCRRWKADDKLKHIPFIIYTGTYTEPKDEQLALRLGAERFIIKPQDPEVLVQIIHAILAEYSKREIVSQEKPLGEEMETLSNYNEVLFHKLEKKVLQLESEITYRKKAQQSLACLNTELEARVEERTKTLEEAHEQLARQEKLAMIGKLAGSVAHELRNPLGVIYNSIYYLGLKFPDADEKIKKHLKLIQEESTKASKIISDLLDFARMKPDDVHLVDICQLVKETLDKIQKPENIMVDTCFEPDVSKLKIDPRKMEQAFQNIITNAYQAMPEGGELAIRVKQDPEMIEVVFKDTGAGISPENLSRLFEPLFSTKIKGIGLGLSIAKEIVEQFGGKIEVESEVGVGSTFLVKFPIGAQDKNMENYSILPEIEEKDGKINHGCD